MHTNDQIASLATQPCNSTYICNIDLILLQKKALGMQNTMMQKSEFLKMRDCSGFLQIGSQIAKNKNKEQTVYLILCLTTLIQAVPSRHNFFYCYTIWLISDVIYSMVKMKDQAMFQSKWFFLGYQIISRFNISFMAYGMCPSTSHQVVI